jgi:hypothetical protein
MAGAVGYTTRGASRGHCGHTHKDIAAAMRCRAQDEALCIAKGGHTDRRVYAVGPGHGPWRELDDAELEAVAALRGIENSSNGMRSPSLLTPAASDRSKRS